MRGRKHPKDRYTRMISLRMPEHYYQRALTAAEAEGVSVSSWLRRLIGFELSRLRRGENAWPRVTTWLAGTSNSAAMALPTRQASCEHMTMSGTGLISARCQMGCEITAVAA